MLRKTPILVGLALAVLCASVAPTAGQATQGSIVGNVTDTSGAVLPGVTVVATAPHCRFRRWKR